LLKTRTDRFKEHWA
jgi:serine/threonine protein kinase